jgi:Cys-tRNA(Pro)/Cys-tRNA(Cys) deacylase
VARAATPAITALLAAEVPHEVLRYHHDPQNESFGEEAVNELAEVEGVEPERVYKTLIIALPNGLAVAVLPVPCQLFSRLPRRPSEWPRPPWPTAPRPNARRAA